jgi:hypothetical protein
MPERGLVMIKRAGRAIKNAISRVVNRVRGVSTSNS